MRDWVSNKRWELLFLYFVISIIVIEKGRILKTGNATTSPQTEKSLKLNSLPLLKNVIPILHRDYHAPKGLLFVP